MEEKGGFIALDSEKGVVSDSAIILVSDEETADSEWEDRVRTTARFGSGT